MRMEVRLAVTNGKANVKQVVLGPETIIGRSQECNLKIASSQVSRRHSRITVSDYEVRVSDLGSANGTFLNGRALPPDTEVVVAPGNALTIGPLRFVFHFTPPPPPKAVDPLPESDTKDAIPLSLLGRPAPQLGEEETVDAAHRASAPASPLGPALAPAANSQDHETDFEEGLPDRTLTGLKKEPVVVRPPEGAADTVLDMNLEEEARRKAAMKAAADKENPTAEVPGEVSESNTDSGTALLSPADDRQGARDSAEESFPDFKAADVEDEDEAEEEPSPKSRKPTEKKKWGLLGGMFGKGKPKRREVARDELDEEVESEAVEDAAAEVAEPDPVPAPNANKKKSITPDDDDTVQIGPPVSFDEAAEATMPMSPVVPATPAPVAAAKSPAAEKAKEFDPADFLMALSSEEAAANLSPKTKPPEEKPEVGKPSEKRVAPRLTPEVKGAAKPGPAPQIKSGKPGEKQAGDPSLSDFLKNL